MAVSPTVPAASSSVAMSKDGEETRVVAKLSWGGGESASAEPAGRAYWDFLRRVRAVDAKKLANVSVLSVAEDGGDERPDDGAGADFSLREDLTPAIVEDLTYYELLGFDKYGNGIKDEALKRAYRRAVLTYHPDKTGSSRGEEDEVFMAIMAIQKAFETLSDPTKRKQYDSSLEFDDAIPDEGAGADDPVAFFAVYGPVFSRNERFAVLLPAPPLGDADTPIEEVNKFYEYWVNFESWRDFTLEACEHDLDDAEDRYHKRWMQKENDKKNRDLKRKEYKRLTTLIDRARAADPRIRQAREAEREAKRQAKEAKAAAAAAVAAAATEAAATAEREAREAEERRKDEAKTVKAEKDRKKKELRRQRKAFRVLLAAAPAGSGGGGGENEPFSAEEVEFACESMELDALTACVEVLGGADGQTWNAAGVEAARALLAKARAELLGEEAAAAAAREAELERLREAARRAEEERKQRAVKPWGEDELSCLAKAAVRFPAGAQNRWDHVAMYLAQTLRLPERRSKEDCIAKFQELQAAPVAAKAKEAAALRRQQATAVPSTPLAAAAVPVATAAAAAAAMPLPPPSATAVATPMATAAAATNGSSAAAPPRPPMSSEAAAAAAAEATVAPSASPRSAVPANVAPADAAAVARAAGSAPARVEVVGAGGWSQQQQQQLEDALARFPPSMDKNERWKSISAEVEGKTKKECVERFKVLKAKLQAKGGGGAGAKSGGS
ncbi:unnamed protein product [Phaeothamnion confervicola]